MKNFGPASVMWKQSSEPDAELAGDVDARLVGEAHAGRQRCRLAMDQVDRLMHLHADAMAGAMRGARQLVSRASSPSFRKCGARRRRRSPPGRPIFAASMAICWPRWT